MRPSLGRLLEFTRAFDEFEKQSQKTQFYDALITIRGKLRNILTARTAHEISMKHHRNERAGETGDPREHSPTSGILRHDPSSPRWEASWLTTKPPHPLPSGLRRCVALLLKEDAKIQLPARRNVTQCTPALDTKEVPITSPLSVVYQRTFTAWTFLDAKQSHIAGKTTRARVTLPRGNDHKHTQLHAVTNVINVATYRDDAGDITSYGFTLYYPGQLRTSCQIHNYCEQQAQQSTWGLRTECHIFRRSYEPTAIQTDKGRGNGRSQRKSPDQRHDSHGVTRPGIEPGSPWWEAGALTAQPAWPQIYG
ncbi:hypothetical protein PR048_029527 [Dryococelus australis]|uniref:Uncharacterized protein n=1 Tax=Dryococelus australis TaxID=614101 RepID=A0ABQ9GDN0_9NEOP|nr:hypothetical protein PR048_029527 [Dryococelus australis]